MDHHGAQQEFEALRQMQPMMSRTSTKEPQAWSGVRATRWVALDSLLRLQVESPTSFRCRLSSCSWMGKLFSTSTFMLVSLHVTTMSAFGARNQGSPTNPCVRKWTVNLIQSSQAVPMIQSRDLLKPHLPKASDKKQMAK